ncbi:uncharacterized protein LOC124686497 [Lolium rigidum]|uniref:uncharacterized protein LOC124686497 n=1 Tax=Lolium rigidum TaxID=89674 RepID=UPI001F5C2F25|nr:uncharacterized protein LOC124686497 [Lolium rigidum]
MASIPSKLLRAACATRPSCSAVRGIAVGARPAAAIRVSSAGSPKSEEEEEEVRPKSEVARAAHRRQPRAFPLADPISPEGGPMSEVAPHVPTIRYIHLPVDENALKSDEAMWAFYEYWCKYHGISRDRHEMERRFKIFSDTARDVHRYNSVVCGIGRAAMTKFSDQTEEEKACLLGGRTTPVWDS